MLLLYPLLDSHRRQRIGKVPRAGGRAEHWSGLHGRAQKTASGNIDAISGSWGWWISGANGDNPHWSGAPARAIPSINQLTSWCTAEWALPRAWAKCFSLSTPTMRTRFHGRCGRLKLPS